MKTVYVDTIKQWFYLFTANLSVISLGCFFLQSLPFLQLLRIGKRNSVNSLKKSLKVRIQNFSI